MIILPIQLFFTAIEIISSSNKCHIYNQTIFIGEKFYNHADVCMICTCTKDVKIICQSINSCYQLNCIQNYSYELKCCQHYNCLSIYLLKKDRSQQKSHRYVVKLFSVLVILLMTTVIIIYLTNKMIIMKCKRRNRRPPSQSDFPTITYIKGFERIKF